MDLPNTGFDFIRKSNPYLLACAEADASDAKASGWKHTISTIEEVPSITRFDTAVKTSVLELYEKVSKDSGYPVSMLIREAHQSPEFEEMVRQYSAQAALDYHCLFNFFLFGKKTFYFTDGLAQRLSFTEINAAAEMLQLPFPSCIYVFTAKEVINALYKIHLGSADVPTDIDYEAPVSLWLTMCEPDADIPYRRLVLVATHAKWPHTYLLVKRSLCLSDGWTLDRSLHTDWTHLTGKSENEWAQSDDSLFYNDGLLFFRVIFNACLYLSSSTPEVKDEASTLDVIEKRLSSVTPRMKRRTEMQAAREQYSSLPYTAVGANVPPIVIDPNRAVVPGIGHTFRHSLSARFIVRGHWRLQAYGPNQQERRLQWIEPYEKGPEMADMINRPYVVK